MYLKDYFIINSEYGSCINGASCFFVRKDVLSSEEYAYLDGLDAASGSLEPINIALKKGLKVDQVLLF